MNPHAAAAAAAGTLVPQLVSIPFVDGPMLATQAIPPAPAAWTQAATASLMPWTLPNTTALFANEFILPAHLQTTRNVAALAAAVAAGSPFSHLLAPQIKNYPDLANTDPAALFWVCITVTIRFLLFGAFDRFYTAMSCFGKVRFDIVWFSVKCKKEKVYV